MADTSLTVEGGQAKHCQAQLTRLQRALGLKEEPSSDAELIYGQKVATVEPDKPTNFSRKGDVILASLDLASSPKDYVRVSQKSRTFNGYRQSTAVPKQGLKELSLGGIRRAINDALEPLCLDHCGNSEHQNEQSNHSHSDSKNCNPKRDHCDNPAHETDQDNYDHTLHKLCKPRRNIILLLSEKEKSLRLLQMLGCDPHRHLHIVDIISVNELYQAFLARDDYSRRNPMTGGNRTKINHDWEDLSTAGQVWSALGYESTESYGKKERSFANLKAAIDIACKDALSSSWLRTLEQIEGGACPGPWLKLHSRSQAEEFLIEYDVARASPICYNKMKVQVKALTESLRLLSPTVFDALVGQIARTHNYTHLLDKDAAESSRSSSVATPDVPDASQNRVEAPKVAATGLAVNPHTTATKPSTPIPSAGPSPTLPPLPLGAKLDEDIQKCCSKYHRDQEAVEKYLSSAPVSSEDKKEYDSLFDWKPYTDHKRHSKITPITCDNYPRVFAIISRKPTLVLPPGLLGELRGTISNRERAQKWYQRLPRRGENGGHQNFISVLKEGEAVLQRMKSA